MPAAVHSPNLREAIAQLQRHFLQVVLPLWQGPGWNAELQLPYEALDREHCPLVPQRYRAMACARQLYVFASASDTVPGAAERAAQLFASLNKHFRDPLHDGWFYSVAADGQPLDTCKDLYTHAFVIFACAHYLGRLQARLANAVDPHAHSAEIAAVRATLDCALAMVEGCFSTADGLYHAQLNRNATTCGSGPLQNPLMHLAEALLAVLSVRQDSTVRSQLLALCEAMHRQFIDPAHGVLLEKPFGAVDNWYEPGHQFEWLYLLGTSPLLRDHALHGELHTAFAIAQAQGVAANGAVLAMLQPDGGARDANQRIWAQAEYLRALTLQADADAVICTQIQRFTAQFLCVDGWNESCDGQGSLNRHDMPSTTPYHLATCYQGLADWLSAR